MAAAAIPVLPPVPRPWAIDGGFVPMVSPADALRLARIRLEDLAARSIAGDDEIYDDVFAAASNYIDLAYRFHGANEDYARLWHSASEAIQRVADADMRRRMNDTGAPPDFAALRADAEALGLPTDQIDAYEFAHHTLG